MDKQKLLRFIDSQIKELDREIRDIEYEDYDYENTHEAINFFGKMNKLNDSKEILITMRNIIENMED